MSVLVPKILPEDIFPFGSKPSDPEDPESPKVPKTLDDIKDELEDTAKDLESP